MVQGTRAWYVVGILAAGVVTPEVENVIVASPDFVAQTKRSVWMGRTRCQSRVAPSAMYIAMYWTMYGQQSG
jgi:hypothetical protein